MKRNPFELLPDAVEVGGALVRIDSDFRVGVAIENEMLCAHPDIAGLLAAFYPNGIPSDMAAAAEKMLWFYANTENGEPEEGEALQIGASGRWYDFTQDADVLMASFRQAYGIDLEKERIHWWKFRRLMFGLPQDTPFVQRVHYRIADINKLPREQRKHYRRMQRLYALKKTDARSRMTASERDAAMKARVQRRFEEARNGPKG